MDNENENLEQQGPDSGQKVAHLAGKGAATYFGAGVGGAAYELASKTPVVQELEKGVGEIVNQTPVLNDVAQSLDNMGALDAGNVALDALGGGMGSAASAAGSAGSAASGASSAASAAGTGANAASGLGGASGMASQLGGTPSAPTPVANPTGAAPASATPAGAQAPSSAPMPEARPAAKAGQNNGELLYDPNSRTNRRMDEMARKQSGSSEAAEEALNKANEVAEEKEKEKEEKAQQEKEAKQQGEAGAKGDSDGGSSGSSGGMGDAVKGQANEAVKGLIKEKGKMLAGKAVAFIAANPWVLIPIGIFLIIIIFTADGGSDGSGSSDKIGLNGYEYFHVENLCETVSVYDPETGTYTEQIDFETQYIPGVVRSEIGGFSDSMDMLMVGAIAARSYAIRSLGEDCVIEGSQRVQAFTFDDDLLAQVTAEDHPIRMAADATMGLVMVNADSIVKTYYDAGCYRGQDESTYHIGYGSLTLGEEKIQRIPKSWVESHGLNYYVQGSINNSQECWNNHGYGMSQWGAYYLATEQGHNYLDLIQYYYGDVELMSIYQSLNTTVTSNGTADILTTTLRSHLLAKGTTAEEFNDYLLTTILQSGIGTRQAAVTAASNMVGGLYKYYGARLPYTYCGQHYCTLTPKSGSINRPLNKSAISFYGVDPDWGMEIEPFTYTSDDGTFGPYYRYGPDCSGFVAWVLHNAGFTNAEGGSSGYAGLGDKVQLGGSRIAQPGDLMYHPGHIMFIVDVDREEQVYYIAHASGGSSGVKINTVSFNDTSEYFIDMSDFYANNALNIMEEEFIQRYRDGYVDGYTKEFEYVDISTRLKTYYLVGDSRTVGLCYYNALCDSQSVCDNTNCLAEIGVGYGWLEDQVSKIEDSAMDNIILNLGVNDLVNTNDGSAIAEKYFNFIEDLAEDNPRKMFYVMSVNPVGEGESVNDEAIKTYNSKMKQLIWNSDVDNLEYMDTYNGVTFSNPALHYDVSTYKAIYNYILKEV